MLQGKKGKFGAFFMALAAAAGVLAQLGVPLGGLEPFLVQLFGAGAGLGLWGVRSKQERDNPTAYERRRL